ncbi:MAG: AMP-binding protein [Flavobacteriaceae bacterium]
MNKTDTLELKFYECEKKLYNRPFLKQPFGNKWEIYTWSEVGHLARKLAAGLKSLGLRDKAHIGLVSKNCREWVIADIAIMMAGYVSVPFFPTLKSNEIKNLLEFGEVDALFAGKLENWKEMKKGVPEDMPVIAFPQYKDHSKISKAHQWNDFINSFEPIEKTNVPKLDDVWTIIFTSGTTGTPKGVVIDYRAYDATKILIEKSNVLKIDQSGDNNFFSYLPLNHIAERIVVEHTCFRYGGSMSFVESLDTFAKNLSDTQPTVFFAVPRIWTKFQMGILGKIPQKKLEKLLNIPLISGFLKKKFKKSLGLSKARAIVSGAAPMMESQRVWFREIDIHITNGYGMTENLAICTQLDARETRKPGSVGRAQDGVEISIDPENNEILMRGEFMMKGYFKAPEITAEVLKNGWLHTGDQGHIDEEGYLFITGRVKDNFKTTKGKYIEPLTIENYFADIIEFEQICVTGMGIPQPICLAVLSEVGKTISPEKLTQKLEKKLEDINAKLDNYKKISTLIVVKDEWSVENELITPTLKIKRNKIDQKYQSNFEKWHKADETILWES